MKREFSAGGVLVRRLRGPLGLRRDPAGGQEARPVGAAEGTDRRPGEKPEETACAKWRRRPGRTGRLVVKLGDVRYVYTWAGERIFKVVSFYLLRYTRGRLGDLPPATAHEVAEVRWLPLEEGPRLLAYERRARDGREGARGRPGTMIPRAPWQETTTPCTP